MAESRTLLSIAIRHLSMGSGSVVMIISNPALPETTIAILDGGSKQAGDMVTFNFSSPLDTTISGLRQSCHWVADSATRVARAPTNALEASSRRLSSTEVLSRAARETSTTATTSMGTHYGRRCGRLTDNPADPLSSFGGTDDELYNLVPFLTDGDTVCLRSQRPTRLAMTTSSWPLSPITARATVSTEICNDGIDNDGDLLVDAADPDCQVTPPESPSRHDRRWHNQWLDR